MFTASATATFEMPDCDDDQVANRAELIHRGCTPSQIEARLAAGRWRRYGRAVVRHNGPLTFGQRCRIALLNTGPHSVLTSFTAAQTLGMTGWERDEIHVLAPVGVATPSMRDISIRLHLARHFDRQPIFRARRCHRVAPSLSLAASSFHSPRPAIGIMAAGVQQGRTRPDELRQAVTSAVRSRHRAVLLTAIDDIAMGAQALAEIDFAQLCRRNRLPEPVRQAIRFDSNGRRRYLDVQWKRSDGRIVVVEIDGALHLAAAHWFADQLRQNDVALSGALVLRYPSFIVRTDPTVVINQLARALFD